MITKAVVVKALVTWLALITAAMVVGSVVYARSPEGREASRQAELRQQQHDAREAAKAERKQARRQHQERVVAWFDKVERGAWDKLLADQDAAEVTWYLTSRNWNANDDLLEGIDPVAEQRRIRKVLADLEVMRKQRPPDAAIDRDWQQMLRKYEQAYRLILEGLQARDSSKLVDAVGPYEDGQDLEAGVIVDVNAMRS